MNNNKKADPMEQAVSGGVKNIGKLFRMLWQGIKCLKSIPYLIGFAIFALITVLAYFNPWIYGYIENPYVRQAAPIIVFFIPVLYLMVIGAWYKKTAEVFYEKFKEINFIGRDNRYPYLLSHKQDGVKDIYTFRSNIPFDVWESSRQYLQTALDCNILKIDQPGSKKDVQLITIDAKVKIPDRILWENNHIDPGDGEIVIGENMMGVLKFNLNKVPHVLAAGTTGSGKSVALRMMLWQLAMKGSVIFMLDFKGGVEFGIEYEEIGVVVTERDKAVELLDLLVQENKIRLELFRAMKVKNLKEYNEMTGLQLSRIGVFCDEIGEMLDKKGAAKADKEVMEQLEGLLSTLARLSRATGINLFLGVQRPDANVLTGQIKNNLPVRICGHFPDKAASEIVLGNTRAQKLPDKGGRLLFQAGSNLSEFQGYYFDDAMLDIDKLPEEERMVMLPELARRSGATVLPVKGKKGRSASSRSEPNIEAQETEDLTPPGEVDFNF